MGEKYLIDTSGVIKYLTETFPVKGLLFMDEILNKGSNISFISEIELQVWNPEDPDDLKVYQSFVSESTVVGLQDGIIQETIRIRKYYKLKLPDALIVATALINDMTLIADNDKDFMLVPELKYINPKRLSNTEI
ncbi:MAG: type II toxin-antitoxin system VapC family toxin [Bacteroidota bacterium]|nr:type II toxin-antitoxin system VapC family toxin [Bacteroidota bacterium]